MLRNLLLIALETLLLLAAGLYIVMYVLAKGPSPTAGREFAMTMRETSALKFLAGWYFSDEELAEMEAGKNEGVYVETDTSLIQLDVEPKSGETDEQTQADA